MTDDESGLVARARGGDHDAFLTLLARHDRPLMSLVYRFTCDLHDREDLYQDIALHCFRSLRTFRSRSSFGTWLHRIALNRCLTWVRRRVPEPERAASPGNEVDWERREKLRAVHRALSRLGGQQRICFHLHYVEDWTVSEIAAFLECRDGTVKSHLNRARAKIRNQDEVMAWRTTP